VVLIIFVKVLILLNNVIQEYSVNGDSLHVMRPLEATHYTKRHRTVTINSKTVYTR
jgi:hypothetical protein